MNHNLADEFNVINIEPLFLFHPSYPTTKGGHPSFSIPLSTKDRRMQAGFTSGVNSISSPSSTMIYSFHPLSISGTETNARL